MTQEALQLPTTPPYPGAMMVDDINKALATLASSSAGDAEPGNPYPNQWWAHGASGWMKQRNAANSGWINRFKLADAMTAVGASLFAAASEAAARSALSVFSAAEYQTQIATRFTAAGTADAMTGALAPVITAYADGLRVTCTPPGSNTLTAPTLGLHTLGGKKIFKRAAGAAVALAVGDYNGSGPFDFEFVSALDSGAGGWILLNPLPSAMQLPGVIAGRPRKLRVSASGASSSVSLTADEIVVESSSHQYMALRGVALTINTAAVGVNGLDVGPLAASAWYYVFVIAKADGTPAGLVSASSTAPILPSGYTYCYCASSFFTDSTANKYPFAFRQVDSVLSYNPAPSTNLSYFRTIASAVTGTALSASAVTWSAGIGVSAFFPPNATRIRVMAINSGYVALSDTNSTAFAGNAATTSSPIPWSTTQNSNGDKVIADFPYTATLYVAGNSGAPNVYALGYEVPL